MATHSSILAWKISWTEEPGGLQSLGLQSQTQLSTHAHILHAHLEMYILWKCQIQEYPELKTTLNCLAVHICNFALQASLLHFSNQHQPTA